MKELSALTSQSFQPHTVNNSYYRFYLQPLTPDPHFVNKHHRLNFRATLSAYSWGTVEIHSTYFFNVQAAFDTSFANLMRTLKYRHIDQNKNILVVDFEKRYFDQWVQYRKEAFVNVSPTILTSNVEISSLSRHSLIYHVNDYLEYPVYACVSQLTYTTPDGSLAVTREFNTNKKDLLLSEDGYPIVAVKDYKPEDEKLGQDILLSARTHQGTVSYMRTLRQLSDWNSHIQPQMNKKSYLGLTQGCFEESGNAVKIAKLFADYAEKGEGFSALWHFHLFRHTANVAQSKVISQTLKTEQFKDADNVTVAQYLCEQYNELNRRHPVNPEGSFARRTNYAILQLTNGLCHNVNEFQQWQQVKELQNTQSVG